MSKMTKNKKYLNMTLEVTIDGSFGSKHPKRGFIYPVNYILRPDDYIS